MKSKIGKIYLGNKKDTRNHILTQTVQYNKYKKSLVRKLQSENKGSLAFLKKIPDGLYCYTRIDGLIGSPDFGDLELPRININPCPYWYSIHIEENELDNHVGIVAMNQKHIGGCKLLKQTDDDMDGWGLLWDQCKECPF